MSDENRHLMDLLRYILRAVVVGGISASASVALVQAEAGLVEKIPALWHLQPGQDQGKEIEVRPGGVVTLSTLIPDHAAELTSDAIREGDGAIIAPKGEQLYSRDARGTIAYCTVSSRKVLDSTSIAQPNSAATDPCFIDRDGDGKFDESFRIDSWNATYFGTAFISKKKVQIKPSPYKIISPDDFQQKFYAGVKYIGTGISKKEQFSLAIGGNSLATPICCSYLPAGDQYPRTVDIFGGSYSILRNDRGVIRLRVEKSLPGSPFSIRGNI